MDKSLLWAYNSPLYGLDEVWQMVRAPFTDVFSEPLA